MASRIRNLTNLKYIVVLENMLKTFFLMVLMDYKCISHYYGEKRNFLMPLVIAVDDEDLKALIIKSSGGVSMFAMLARPILQKEHIKKMR